MTKRGKWALALGVVAALAWVVQLDGARAPAAQWVDCASPLFEAAKQGDVARIEEALAAGADVNAVSDCRGQRALHLAADGGHLEAVDLLLSRGACVDCADEFGNTALYEAAGYVAVMQRLLEAGADPNASRLGPPIVRAASGGHRDVVELLLAHGADLRRADYTGNTALHQAAEGQYTLLATLLIAHGAPPNARNSRGNTALHVAIDAGRQELVDANMGAPTDLNLVATLIDGGIDPNGAGNHGWTPLHLAVGQGRVELVRALLSHGADPNIPDVEGKTPMAYLPGGPDSELGLLLIAHGGQLAEPPEFKPDAEAGILEAWWEPPAVQREYASRNGVPLAKRNGQGQRLVLIPPGQFRMGSTLEEYRDYIYPELETCKNSYRAECPAHDVTISYPFYMAATELTNREYDAFIDATGYDGEEAAPVGYLANRQPGGFGADVASGDPNYPLVQVSWFNAQVYCRWLTEMERATGRIGTDWEYRLPTEAEWEYACRAGTSTAWSFGDSPGLLNRHIHKYEWVETNSGKRTHPVGQKLPNPWGLFDMHGNVGEWCDSELQPYPYQAEDGPEDSYYVPDGWGLPSRVVRGGTAAGHQRFSRSATRNGDEPVGAFRTWGFRVVLVPRTPDVPASALRFAGSALVVLARTTLDQGRLEDADAYLFPYIVTHEILRAHSLLYEHAGGWVTLEDEPYAGELGFLAARTRAAQGHPDLGELYRTRAEAVQSLVKPSRPGGRVAALELLVATSPALAEAEAALRGATDPLVAALWHEGGLATYLQGDPEAAHDLLLRAVDAEAVTWHLWPYARVAEETGRAGDALHAYQRAVAIARANAAEAPDHLAHCLDELAAFYQRRGEWAEAVRVLEEVLSYWKTRQNQYPLNSHYHSQLKAYSGALRHVGRDADAAQADLDAGRVSLWVP